MESRARASPEQFSVLIDFMERYGDLSKPQPGPQGRAKSDRLWQEVTNVLNSIGGGVQKTSEKWKKVWADWKTKTKKKYLTIKQQAGGTGGGPNSVLALTAMEERVVALIGVAAVVGQVGIQELGFNTTSSETGPDDGSTQQFPLEQDHAIDIMLEDHSETTAVVTPSQSQVHFTPRVTVASSAAALSPPSPPSRAAPRPSSPPPAQRAPPPVAPLPPPAAAPPLPARNNRRQASTSPHSTASTPRRTLLRARRNRGLTPFERAAEQFAAVEQRRLRYEEAREKRLHELEIERLRLEAQRIEVAREHNQLLHQLSLLGQRLIDVITQQSPSGSLPSTDPI